MALKKPDAAEKIGILVPKHKMISFAAPKAKKESKSGLSFGEVYYSNKRTVLSIGRNSKDNWNDIF